MTGQRPRGQSGLGLMLLAAGRRRGFLYFGVTSESYLNSLAPLVAFALVTGGITGLGDGPRAGLEIFCAQLIGILAPPVLAHPLCRRWAREAAWALYANLLNWVQLLLMIVLSLDAMLVRLISALGLGPDASIVLGSLAMLIYAAWLQWFVARGALRISRLRVAALLAVCLIGTNILIGVPLWLGGDLNVLLGPGTLGK